MKRPTRIALALLALSCVAPALAQQAYPTAEAAAEAFVAAVEKRDHPALQQVLGAQWRDYIPTEGIDQEDVDAFLAQWKQSHRVVADGAKAQLPVRNHGWTLPIPLQQDKARWRFGPKGSGEVHPRSHGSPPPNVRARSTTASTIVSADINACFAVV